jgi:hypothetical protein
VASASRFGVYRNNVIAGLINAVAARYPVVRRLLWDDAFNRAAYLYVTSRPPRSPVLLEYAQGFPQFLRDIGKGAAADYLADIAELESARTRAYHAADVPSFGRETFAAASPEQWPELCLKLHPSLGLIKSHCPVVGMWQANLGANDNTLGVWRPECALITRPHLNVEVRLISAAMHEFIKALLEGCKFAVAIERVANQEQSFDLVEAFQVLIESGAVIAFELPDGSN